MGPNTYGFGHTLLKTAPSSSVITERSFQHREGSGSRVVYNLYKQIFACECRFGRQGTKILVLKAFLFLFVVQ